MVRSSEIKLHNRETAIEETGGARTPRRLYVTTCRLPLQIVGIVDIQQLLANLDTMSTLVRDTLVSHAEPPPSGWTDITLEQSYEYWSS